MNLVNVGNVEVFIDYCHNAAGMRAIGDFVETYTAQNAGRQDLAKSSRIGMIGAAGDRRDDDMRELGSVAAQHFDVIIREDDRPRGRRRGEAAELIAEGVRSAMADGARCRQVEIVLDEIDAVNHVMARSNPGDLVLMCVDKHAQVVAELENRTHSAQAGSHASELVGDPDLDPAVLARDAEAQGQEAEVEALAADHEAVETSEPTPA
ncbi:MAG: cyanophycin synthetase [Lapillicoccus sp.]